MIRLQVLLSCFLVTPLFLSTVGCGGGSEATVAPATESEIEEYKKQVYGAEEESQEEQQAAAR